MHKTQRSLKDAVKDANHAAPVKKKRLKKRRKKANMAALKLGIALIVGFAGGFSTARWLLRL